MTLESALEAENIEKWVHEFLTTVGNNVSFSDGLKLEKRTFKGPIKMPLSAFKRCCGPESDMPFYEARENFERRVCGMMDHMKKGWSMPPLILKHDEDGYELSDGNHRYEALKRSGIKAYWVILWETQ